MNVDKKITFYYTDCEDRIEITSDSEGFNSVEITLKSFEDKEMARIVIEPNCAYEFGKAIQEIGDFLMKNKK